MDVLEKAFEILSKYPLCDHCLGRQFALLGYSMENNVRGKALKVSLTMQASELNAEKKPEGIKRLKVLAGQWFFKGSSRNLKTPKETPSKRRTTVVKCSICDGKFEFVD